MEIVDAIFSGSIPEPPIVTVIKDKISNIAGMGI